MSEKRSSIILFLTAIFLFWTALYLYVPTLPIYIKTKTISLSMVGLVLSMYGLWMAIIRLPMGVIGDSIGWGKPPIILGLFFAAAGAFIMGKGNALGTLAFGRALTGLSAGTWVLLTGVFSTFFDFENTILAISMLTFSSSFGRNGYDELNRIPQPDWGYSLSFFLASSIGILASILVLFVNEKNGSPRRYRLSPSLFCSLWVLCSSHLLRRFRIFLPALSAWDLLFKRKK